MNASLSPEPAAAARDAGPVGARAGLSRRGFLGALGAGVAGATALPLLSACGAQTGSSGKNNLVVATWKGYGSDLDWALAEFKKLTGASVTFQYMESEQGLIDLLKNGGTGKIDVALPNLQYTRPAIAADLLEPLDTAELVNYQEIFREFRTLPDLTSGDETYAVPWFWGTVGMFHSTKTESGGLDSWAALWDPAFKGKIALGDDPTAMILVGALYLGENPDDPDLAKVEKALKQLKANAKMLWTTKDDFTRAFTTGSITAGNVLGSLAGQLISEHKPLAFTIPKEGAIGFLDNWTIVKGTAKKDLAYQWIDYMCSKGFQARWAANAAWSSPVPANQLAVGALDSAAVSRLQVDTSVLPRLAMQKYLAPEKLQAWTDVWNRVKAS